MMNLFRTIIGFTTVAFSLVCAEQVTTNYSLNEGKITFSVPSDWSVIMQKESGNPQLIAFQVKNPAEQGTEESTRITITTKLIGDVKNFQGFIDAAMDKAKQTAGYEVDKENKDTSELRYSGLSRKTRYLYREALSFNNGIAIHVRCVRPQLKATTKLWIENYDKGCDQIINDLKTPKSSAAQ